MNCSPWTGRQNAILPNIIPFTWPDPDEETIVEKPIIVASPDMLRCAYLHRLNDENEGAIRFVEIAVVDGNLIATYAPRPFFDWGDVQNLQDTSILAENVASVSFLYADFSDDETEDWGERLIWVDEWETEESERMDAPLAVCLTVNWTTGNPKPGSGEQWETVQGTLRQVGADGRNKAMTA